MSLRPSVPSPAACSGLMKFLVPMIFPGSITEPGSRPPCAMPKSVTSARPAPASSRMLSGLTSRCTMPRPCAYARAQATSRSTRAASAGGRGPPADTLAERLALHVAHDEEDEAARLADAMDRDDVRVRESRRHARLAQEPLARRRVAREECRQDLDGDVAIQLHVAREVDHAHAAAAELALERVLAGQRRLEVEEFRGRLG